MIFENRVRVENHFPVEIFEIFHFQKHAPNMDIMGYFKFLYDYEFGYELRLRLNALEPITAPSLPPLWWFNNSTPTTLTIQNPIRCTTIL